MLKKDLVSIIVPTFNRAHLIEETLDSILQQTHTNWECIIVDDGSTDESEALIDKIVTNDNRFIYYKRPSNMLKGANACRNFGLDKSKGDYIVFFDSDDLMTANHLEIKFNALTAANSDYAITKTSFFNYDKGNKVLEKNYNFSTDDLSAYNYISQKINWLTYDICIKSELAKSIRFNEYLMSGQEYNYFSKLLVKSTNGVFVKEVVTLRRYHENSIQGKLKDNKSGSVLGFYNAYWYTYLDIQFDAKKDVRRNLIYKCYRLTYKNKELLKRDNYANLSRVLIKEFGIRGAIYSILLSF